MKVQKVLRTTGEVLETTEVSMGPKELAGKPFICVYGSRRPRKTEGAEIIEKEITKGLKAYIRFEVNSEAMGKIEQGGHGTFTATKRAVELLEMDETKLWAEAIKNMKEYGVDIKSMAQFMLDVTGSPLLYGENPLEKIYIARLNAFNGEMGAGIIAVPCLLEEIREKIGDFTILPCSVHELICIPDSMRDDLEYYKYMVREVNGTELAPEDILSNDIYRFDGLGLTRL